MPTTIPSQYTCFNDAAENPAVRGSARLRLKAPPSPAEAHSRIAIWYAKDTRLGDALPTVRLSHHNNEGTHVLLGCVEWQNDWERLFDVLQGEVWSPNGEARHIIKVLGIHHTSMSVGDVLVCYNPDETVDIWVCSAIGWKPVPREALYPK